MWRTIRMAGIFVAGLGLLAAPGEAHMRDYVLSEPYYTAKRGECEVELRNQVNFAEADSSGSYNSNHQAELEYGLTDHLQLAYYEVYKWDRVDDWQRDAFKLEAKLRFAEAGDWPVDIALYTEYENPNGRRASDSDEVENKVILSKDFGPWNVTGNFIFTKEINAGSHWKYEYTAGISYGLTPRTRVGLELQQGLGDSKDFAFNDTQALYLAPGLYTNVTPHVRVLVSPVFGLTRVSDDIQLRSIVEVEF